MSEKHIPTTSPLAETPPAFGCSCGRVHRFDWTGWSGIERTDGVGSGYVRGQFIPHPGKGDLYDRGFWTHVTTSHGREVR